MGVSGWVGAAMVDRVARDRRLSDLGKAVEACEAEFGEITPEELAAQARADREGAVIVGGRRSAADGRPRSGQKAASA